jgi:hypothetical protein
MLNWINKKIQEYYVKKHQAKIYKPLLPMFKDMFEKNGEGLYLCCIKASYSNIVSKIIGWFSKGWSHCIIFYYSENLQKNFDDLAWLKINKSWNQIYGNKVPLNENIKTLIISSADETGMECFDFSQYEFRQMTIRKIPATEEQKQIILNCLISIIGKPYDLTGLIGWLFKLGDDKYSYYCSENVYDACKIGNIIIAEKEEPSPGQIENYQPTQSWKIYSNVINR